MINKCFFTLGYREMEDKFVYMAKFSVDLPEQTLKILGNPIKTKIPKYDDERLFHDNT